MTYPDDFTLSPVAGRGQPTRAGSRPELIRIVLNAAIHAEREKHLASHLINIHPNDRGRSNR